MPMSDSEFLGYCEGHCQTELGGFHRDHVARLIVLAGETPADLVKEIYYLGPGSVMPLVRIARIKIALREVWA
jgi:hypothetical protein